MSGKDGSRPRQERILDLFGYTVDAYRFCPTPLLFVKNVLNGARIPIFTQADAPNGDLFGGFLRFALEGDPIVGQLVRELALKIDHFDHREIDRDTHGFRLDKNQKEERSI